MKLNKRVLRKPRVEMLPLIDSVFLILVFFIYAFLSMTIHRGLPVTLPVASVADIDKNDYCTVTITAENALFVNKELVSADALQARLAAVLQDKPDVCVYINGDAQADHGVVVDVLNAVKVSGINKVSIETQKGSTL